MNGNQKDTIPYPAYPAFRLMLFLAAGIVLSAVNTIEIWLSFSIFLILLTGWNISEFILKKRYPISAVRTATFFYLLMVSAFGFVLHEIHENKRQTSVEISGDLNLFAWETITVEGEVLRKGKSSSGNDHYTLSVFLTSLPGEFSMHKPYTLRLYENGELRENIEPGMFVKAKITLYAFPEVKNPYEFDYGEWLLENEITGHGQIQEVLSIRQNSGWGWSTIRNKIRSNIDASFTEDTSPLAKALLLGYKEDLNPETATFFSRSGLSHIMAVSGLHVGFVVAPFWLIIPFLWGIRHGKWFGLIAITLILLFYAGITGFSPSVTRASIMAWFLTYGRLFHKVRNSINLTAVAAILILIADPSQLFTIGFQLSFSAVFIILFVMPRVTASLPYAYRFGIKGGVITTILVSIVVQAGLFPILAFYFGEVSVIGPIANTLVLPFMSFIVPAGLLVSLMPVSDGSFIQSGTFLIGFGLQWIEFVATAMGNGAKAYLTIREVPVTLFGCWTIGVGFIAAVHKPSIRWKMLAALLVLVNMLFVEILINRYSENGDLEVTFLDVGQGDAIHIKTPQNRHILIDSGRWSPGYDSGESVIIPYLEARGISTLDAVILSHPHADHIGGMLSLIEGVGIKSVYKGKMEYNSALFESLAETLSREEIPVRYTSAGDLIKIDPAIRLFILGPMRGSSHQNPNNNSVILKLVYNDISFLFTGDAETEQERELVKTYGNFLKSDVYKIGHHVSNTSSGKSFLAAVKPSYAVGSLAFRNKFNHPGRETVTRLHQVGADPFYTSLKGAVVLQSDGRGVSLVEWKE